MSGIPGQQGNLVHPRNLYVASLPSAFTEEQFRTLFGQFGELESTRLVPGTRVGGFNAYGFVMFKEPAGATKALQGLVDYAVDGSRIQVRRARLAPANSPPHVMSNDGPQAPSPQLFGAARSLKISSSRSMPSSTPTASPAVLQSPHPYVASSSSPNAGVFQPSPSIAMNGSNSIFVGGGLFFSSSSQLGGPLETRCDPYAPRQPPSLALCPSFPSPTHGPLSNIAGAVAPASLQHHRQLATPSRGGEYFFAGGSSNGFPVRSEAYVPHPQPHASYVLSGAPTSGDGIAVVAAAEGAGAALPYNGGLSQGTYYLQQIQPLTAGTGAIVAPSYSSWAGEGASVAKLQTPQSCSISSSGGTFAFAAASTSTISRQSLSASSFGGESGDGAPPFGGSGPVMMRTAFQLCMPPTTVATHLEPAAVNNNNNGANRGPFASFVAFHRQ